MLTRPPRRPARTLRSADDLVEGGLLAPRQREAAAGVARRYAIAVTPAMQALISAPDDPIGRQFIPDPAELLMAPGELPDPTADAAHGAVKGIIHRYPDRALLRPLLACPVYCRFCFRREQVGPDGGMLTEAELEACYDWFAAHEQVTEVILTGGDPLMLSPRRLGAILRRLAAIPHMATLRIHSRVPVVDPGAVTADLLAALATTLPLWLVVHANHAREFSPAASAALLRLHGAGVLLLGQSVLLRGVNDSEDALAGLWRAMLAARVKPYYLHHLDPAPGTARFHVPVAEGLWLMAALRGRVSGLAFPLYVRETPGGGGKVPVAAAEAAGVFDPAP